MNELSKLHCSPIRANTSKLNEGEVMHLMAEFPGWVTYEKEGEKRLEKVFKFENFDQAITFTDQVAQEAQKEDHHPSILTEWGKVTVTWWSHKIKGLHQNDFIMAAKTDNLMR